MLCIFFLILTQFNTHYESMQDSIYCSERCVSTALFSHQKSLLSALYTIIILNARTFFLKILTQFNTHYESMWDFIYCSEHQKSLLSALYTITVFNARTLWVYFFFIFSLFHLTLQWHHSLKLIQYAHWKYYLNDCRCCAYDF